MLANFIPGFREIRAPLISGYLWLVFFFLVFNEDLPSSGDPGALAPLFELGAELSTLGLATVSGVAAYLVGSSVQEMLRLAGRLVSPARPLYGEAGTHVTEAGRRDIGNVVEIRVQSVRRELYPVALLPGDGGVDQEPSPAVVEKELPLVRTLLLGERPELVGEVDRLQAEADLRITVAVPLGALAVFLVFEASAGWALGLLPVILLAGQGYERQKSVGDLLAKALRTGRANAPALESFEASVGAALERAELEEMLIKRVKDKDAMSAYKLGNLWAGSEKLERALEPLNFAAKNGVVQAHAEIGFVYERLGQLDKAERNYRDGSERNDEKARKFLAQLLNRLHRGEEALKAASSTADSDGSEAEKRIARPAARERDRVAEYRRRMEHGDAKAALNLGLLLERLDDSEGALEAFARATDLDTEDPQAWKQLGLALSLRARYQEAQAPFRHALEILERQFGPDHLDVGLALDDLGIALGLRGERSQAQSLQERGLEILEKQVGSNHLSVARVSGNLGNTCAALGQYQRALELQERALAIKERQLKPGDLGIAITAGNLGCVLTDLGNYERAEKLLQDSRRTKERIEPGSIGVARGLTDLGIALAFLGQLEEAFDCHEKSLSIFEKRLGTEDLEVARALDPLGITLSALRAHDRALEAHSRSLSIKQAELGGEHPEVARTLGSLGGVHRRLGDLDVSEGLLRRAVAIDEAASGVNQVEFALILRELAQTLDAQGSATKAIDLVNQAIAIQESMLGQNHPELARSLSAKADMLEKFGDLQGMHQAQTRAAEIRGADLPDGDHSDA